MKRTSIPSTGLEATVNADTIYIMRPGKGSGSVTSAAASGTYTSTATSGAPKSSLGRVDAGLSDFSFPRETERFK